MMPKPWWKCGLATFLIAAVLTDCSNDESASSQQVNESSSAVTKDAEPKPAHSSIPTVGITRATPTPPQTMKPAKSPVAAGEKTIVAAGVEFTAPQRWIEQKPSSSMRKAQFELPGEAGPAELVVYYFGPGGAGGRAANVQRWLGQFSNPNRPTSAAQWETSTVTRNNLEHTVVKVSGTYAPISMRPGVPAPTPKPDYAIYGIILEGGPQGTLFIKATGPKATIEVQAAALDAFDQSARLAK